MIIFIQKTICIMYQIKREMTINFHAFKIQKLSACIAYFYPMIVGFVLWVFFLVFLGRGGVQRNNCKLHLYITYLTTSITCTYKIHIIECIKIDIFIGESVIIRKLVAFKTVVRIKIHVYMYPFGDMRHQYFVTYWLSIIITHLITQHFNLTCILLILNCFLS